MHNDGNSFAEVFFFEGWFGAGYGKHDDAATAYCFLPADE